MYKALYWILLSLTILISCSICCLLPRILLAIKIIQACADFVLEVKAVILVPIVSTVLTFGYLVFWIYWSALTYSQGKLVHLKSLPFMHLDIEKSVRNELFFNLFNVLWMVSFFLASSHFIVTCSACLWYSNQLETDRKNKNGKKGLSDKGELSCVLKSIRWLLRYHLGSIAFGSLILALVWAAIIISEYLIVNILFRLLFLEIYSSLDRKN